MLAGITVLVKLVALGKDWLVARQFGAGDDLDAFLVAFLLPSYAVVVLAHSFPSAFLPTYVRVWEQEGAAAAARLANSALAMGCAALVAVALVLLVASPVILPVLGTGFDAAKLATAQKLFYPLIGILVASGVSSMLGAVLNAREHFAWTAVSALAIPLGTVIALLLGAARWGIHALAVGTLLGFVGECLALAAGLYYFGFLPWPKWDGASAALSHVARQYWPLVGGACLMSSSLLVDQAMAASLGSGNVSVLSYGNKIVAFVLGLLAVSLSTVLFPRFSRLIAGGQWDELERLFRVWALATFAVSAPLVAILAVASEPIVRLLFERGAFTPETTAAVTAVQLCYLPQIPFYVLAMVGHRLLSALDCNHILLRIGAMNLALNVGGNLLLMHWFGVRGIAMSTSIVYAIAATVTWLAIRAKVNESRARHVARAANG